MAKKTNKQTVKKTTAKEAVKKDIDKVEDQFSASEFTLDEPVRDDSVLDMEVPEEKVGPLKMDMEIEDTDPKAELEPEPVTFNNEQLTHLYGAMEQNFATLMERNLILEWKLFGENYKGKYRYLNFDDQMYIFGEDKDNVEFIPATSVKEAYAKYLEK